MNTINRSLLMRCLVVLFSAGFASAGFIDIDTPLDKRTAKSLIDGTTYNLVMSDEFNVPNRTFKDGHDSLWTALDKSDDDSSSTGGGSLHFYNSSWVSTTEDGMMKIHATVGKTEWTRYDHVDKEWKDETTFFKSGMVQSWNKFCFTGGIIEVDVILPGNPFVGGLWPAVWMLGNLGRATYEGSTNNIWPWSFDKCDRDLQSAQTISACNAQSHYGMNPYQGRGATEIDILEVMTGNSNGPLPSTDPPVSLPYADFTLQVAPGVVDNRPQSGSLPLRENVVWGHTEYMAQVWYDNLTFSGNTSINPFFYGTYLAETKPEEPVARTKKQAFQADAVGVVHQLTSAHFEEPHTFRVEWQPGKGGRIDWFVKSHKVNDTFSYEGDGEGQDWVHVYGLQDQSLSELMGSQIPNEPSYLIMNLAISSTWGFPYDSPSWCDKCYDCDDPKCTCAFNAGFCNMMKTGDVAMYIDSVRVYQSNNSDAHVGNNHTVGCDPPEYPTKEWIKGHEYRYMRNEPFVYEDKHPLRNTQRGGAKCYNDTDCGGYASENITALYLGIATERRLEEETGAGPLRGTCVKRDAVSSLISTDKDLKMICQCNEGYTGPRCTSLDHFDDTVGAFELKNRGGMPFSRVEFFQMPPFMLFALCILVPFMIWAMVDQVISKHRMAQILQPQPYYSEGSSRQITGRSV